MVLGMACTPASPASPPSSNSGASTGETRALVRGSGSVQVAKIQNAPQIFGSLKGQVRTCYQRRLEQAPTAEGAYSFSLEVDAAGQVTSVQLQPQGNTGAEMDTCVHQALQSARFSPPEGPRAVVTGNFELKPGPSRAGP